MRERGGDWSRCQGVVMTLLWYDGGGQFELVNAILRSSVVDALLIPYVKAEREDGQKCDGCANASYNSTNRDAVCHTSAS